MKKHIAILSLFLFLILNLAAQENARLLRFPAVHGNQVVFSYAGDLYTVPLDGGVARQITSDASGYEMFPRFSPDGKHIAFTGQYDGNTEVFLIPSEGGVPERLTYTATLNRDDISDRMGPNNIVMTWKNDDQIVYRSRKQSFNSFKGQLFSVSATGGLSDELPLPAGGWCSFSPDGKKMAYNRVFREFRTWKYYKGGMADDVWIYDFETKETINITNNEHQDIFPMWSGNKVYFLSDRDRTMNLFVYDLDSRETSKLTSYDYYDIKFPSLGDGSVIYENGGFLYTYDIGSGNISKIDVTIKSDFNNARSGMVKAEKFINSWGISPDGNRLVFGARGDVYSVPAMSGITRNLTQSSGVHDRDVEWSPDGKYISYISDRSGEDEIYIQPQDGNGEAVQLTENSDTYKYNPVWSPDSKKLLWSDKMGRLQFIDVNSKVVKQITEADDWEIRSYSWSPDSRWVAYTLIRIHAVNVIYIYDTESGTQQQITDDWYNSGNPVFDADGKYLFFTSTRDFNPIYSQTEWNHAYRDMNSIYFVTLRKDIESPLRKSNDEVKVKEDTSDPGAEGNGKKKKSKDNAESKDDNDVQVEIDFDGIQQRIVKLPVEAGNYRNLSPAGSGIYYVFNSAKTAKPEMKLFNLKKQKETSLGNVGSFIISADRKKMAINTVNKYAVIDLPVSKVKPDKYLNLGDMKSFTVFEKEWQQIFNESWRQMRDFFYAPNMHGLDWPATKEKYSVLVPYVKNRNDLNYVIGEMIGELNVGHAYVLGGDKPKPERLKTGLLGARLSKDESGYFRIDEILPGENWVKNTRSPLTEVGVDVQEGDYIIAVNGKATNEVNDIYMLLVDQADKQVMLKVNGSPAEAGARDEIVIPVADESGLYYLKWVRGNIEKVNKATDGQIGYIHIPDMGPGGLNEFVKYFFPQLNKKGLIIDDRGNGGGNVSPMIIERLNRELTMYGMSRNNSVTTRPGQLMTGPKVMLVDNYSASDGDLFPYQFKKLKMGTIIGVRTWGGVVGIRGSLPFIDGGDLRRPEFAPFDEEGNWIIEGYGVEPDIVVDNDPAKEYAGEDEQLNKAIEVILEQLKDYPEKPDVPEYPNRSR
jgi:tricorn protease